MFFMQIICCEREKGEYGDNIIGKRKPEEEAEVCIVLSVSGTLSPPGTALPWQMWMELLF